jgi:pyridinium-3,5-biscarboxylic acid mononucleotide sulfurtransferase
MAGDLQNKYGILKKILKDLGSVVVAYSGGVDSTLLLKVAVDTLGDKNILACISAGVVEPKHVLRRAKKITKSIGVRLLTIDADELNDPNFVANKADRCFHCKSHLCQELIGVAAKNGLKQVIFGTNLDDLDDFRPGNRAMKLFGIRSPLAEAKLTKLDIRALSRKLKLETADVPSSPCLASRLVYGLEISAKRLTQIEKAEDFLRTLGLIEFRVRHHDTIARIEAHQEDFKKITAEPNRSRIIKKLKSLGFKYIAIDLQGYRCGSLNETLSKSDKR